LPTLPAENKGGNDPFTRSAQLSSGEPAETQPSAALQNATEEPELEATNDQARDFTANEFEYEIDGDALFTSQSDSASTAQSAPASEPGAEAINQRLEALEAENERLRQRLVRWQVEFENARRRSERERETAQQNIQGELLKEFLPLMDNFERALGFTMMGTALEEFITGIVLIYKQFNALLERHGVAPIEATGEIFNPDLHEAVIIEPRPGYEAHTVIAEIEKGYTIGNRLLRPARVKVATRP
jgi:molecular chaperone GrpE